MYAGRDFDVSDVLESEIYAFDYQNMLAPGDALLSGAWTLALVSGVDASPSSRLVGPSLRLSTYQLGHRITGLQPGCVYTLSCIAQTYLSDELLLWAYVRTELTPVFYSPVNPPAPPGLAAMATILPNGRQQFLDTNGLPLVGGKVYTYELGGSVPKTTWQDKAGTTPNTNPIVLDSLGTAAIWGTGDYRQVVTRSDNSLVWDANTISPPSQASQTQAQAGVDDTTWMSPLKTAQAIVAQAITTAAGGTALDTIIVNKTGQTLPAAPVGPIQLVRIGAAGSSSFLSDAIGGSAVFAGRRANGTPSAPSALANNDVMSVMQGFGYGTTAYSSASRAFFRFRAAEAWTDTAQGAYFEVSLSPIGGTVVTVKFVVEANGDTRPGSDNAQKLGTAALRWSEVFAATGVINTSDGSDKLFRGALTPQEINVGRRLTQIIGIFQWKDAIEAKGEGARLHIGVTAQDVVAAFEAEGLDPWAYGVCCADTFDEMEETEPDEEGVTQHVPTGVKKTRLGLRYDQMYAFVTAASLEEIRSLRSRLDLLEAAR